MTIARQHIAAYDQIKATAGFDGASSAGVNGVEAILQSANSGGMWGPRDGGIIMFLGDVAYLIGGWYGSGYDPDWTDGAITTNQVYKTTDFGVTWTRLLGHSIPPQAGQCKPSHAVAHCKHTVDGVEYMYLFGGDPQGQHSEIRRSSDGATWELMNPGGTPFLEFLMLSAAGSLNGVLYIAGGHNAPNGSGDYVNETATNNVWKSTDHGVTWTDMGAAPWAPRQCQDRLVEHDGKLWVVGGGTYDNDGAKRVYHTDVWCFDGTVWTEVLADGLAPWEGRMYANAVSFLGWIYLLCGSNYVGGNLADSWRSRDGKVWQKLGLKLVPSHADGVGVHPTRGIMHATGNGSFLNPVNTNSPTLLIQAIGGDDFAARVAGLGDMVARVEKANPSTPVYCSEIIVDSGSYHYRSSVSTSNASANTIIYNAYPYPSKAYGGWEFRNGPGDVLQATISGDGSFQAAKSIGFGAGGSASARLDYHAGYARAEFYNSYPGDATYGGFRWANGSGDVSRMELKGDGRLELTNQVSLKSYTVSTLPVATTAGGLIFVADESGGAVTAFSDGANWRRTTDRAIVS